jgi:hypothetical protein
VDSVEIGVWNSEFRGESTRELAGEPETESIRAEVRVARPAIITVSAGDVERDTNFIAHREILDIVTHCRDRTRGFVTEYVVIRRY